MTWPAHWLLRIEGQFRASQTLVLETWTNSIRFSGVGTPTPPLEWLTTVAVPAIEAFYAQAYIGNSVYVTAAKFNGIDPNGHYTNEDETIGYWWEEGDMPRGSSTTQAEPQRALAVSWTTDATRGRASKGRIFLPGFITPVSADLLIATNVAQAIEQNAETFLEALNAGSYTASIVSGVGAGTIRPITGVRVGRAVDTQRRRRRSLPENYWDVLPNNEP